MAEFIENENIEAERDPYMPSEEQIKGMSKKKRPILRSQKVALRAIQSN